jgi:hypothetical protein
MSKNRVAELNGKDKTHGHAGHTGGQGLNGRANLNGTGATADLPSNAVGNGANGVPPDPPSGRDAAGKFLPEN